MSDNKKLPILYTHKLEVRTAILVDGGFYRERAKSLANVKSPKERADELEHYCQSHLYDKYEQRSLYRIFYYDCPPIENGVNVYNPLTQRSLNLGKTDNGKWMKEFLEELKHRRKFALRLGRLGTRKNNAITYNLKPESTKALLNGTKKIDDLTDSDLEMNVTQKGVDMKIGVDIASMAFKKQVQQIILIAGDGDFVPAAKLARREGIDFILDPMGNHIPDDLYEHIDGLKSKYKTLISKPCENGDVCPPLSLS